VAADDLMKYIIAPCAVELGYDKPIRADSLPEPGRITSQIIDLLNGADLVIADLTANNANVFYELSCRHAVGKPAIHMALDGTPLPFDVADNRTIFYTMHASRVERAKEELTGQIKRIEEPGYKARNPISDAIGLIALEKSTEPTQQAIASPIRQVASLQGDISDLRLSLAPQPMLDSGQNSLADLAALSEWSRSRAIGPTGPRRNALRDMALAGQGTMYVDAANTTPARVGELRTGKDDEEG
jgi:hypothetical protein